MTMIASMEMMMTNSFLEKKDIVWICVMIFVVFPVIILSIVLVSAFAEITNIQPIEKQYTFGQAVTIIGNSDQDIVNVKIVDEQDNAVEILQLIANGEFRGVSMITPSLWSPGQYVIVMDDGHQKKAMEFLVVGELTELEPIALQDNEINQQLLEENKRLKERIAALESEVENLRIIINEQLKVIYEWIVGR